ncbi:MAG: extracellular solute-binding protein [Treponema sp.]|jgi:putative aldouronate transport system substrate-binding protein|nr:extracellular solute-binding protein [Treponema sp.]
MKRVVLLSFILCCAASLGFAGGRSAASSSPSETAVGTADQPGWKLNASKPVQFDWYLNFSWFPRQWGQSAVSKYITQQTGVNIRFIVPAGNEAERLNAMIAGDSLPDLITLGWWESQVGMMIDAGMVEPLNKLAEQYDPYFFKVAKQQIIGWYNKPDGNIYGYPNASFTPDDYEKYQGKMNSNRTFLVRKDMYEAIGSPDMTTPEGFLAGLRAAKAKFPTVNGQPIIPFAAQEFSDTGNDSFQGYLAQFLALPYEENGQFIDNTVGPQNSDYIRWLKTFRQAVQEGLMPMDAFVDKRVQIEEKSAQGRYFSLLYQISDMRTSEDALYAQDPNMIYIAVDGPKNSRGSDPVLPGGAGISGWTVTLISKNCKDKARAIQFLSYLISEEGQLATRFGVPGVTYNMVNGIPRYLPAMEQLNLTDKNRQETEYGFDYTYWMLMDTAWAQQFPTDQAPSMEPAYAWTRPYVRSYAQYDNLELTPGSDEALIYDEVQRRWGRDLPRLLLAKTDAEFDTIWNEYQQFKNDRGFAKVLARRSALLAENKKKLGIQ